MKRLMTLATAAVLTFVLAAPALAADPVRPFGGWTNGADGMGPPTCPGAAWQFTDRGTGAMLHLGRVTVVITHCTWIDTFSDGVPATGHFGPGTMTFTAADGDTLVLAHSGTFEVVPTADGLFSYINATWVVAGGTGRFAGATGSGGSAGIGDIGAETTSATYWGTIAY